MPQTSWPGSPSIIQLASARPTPPPWLKPAITPQATQKFFRPLHRADQRIAVGREGEGAVDDLADAGLAELGEMLERRLQARRDAVEIVGQQVLAEIPRRLALAPGLARLLVGADQHAAAFLAHVDLALEIDDVELVDLGVDDAGNVLGDEIMVLHREHRQFEPDHAADLARPQAAAVDDMLGEDVALLGDHVPRAVRARLQIDDAVEAHDLGAGHRRAFGVGLRDAPGIEMALDRIEHRADEMLLLDEGIHPRGFVDRDDLEVHAEIAAARARHLQPVEPLLGAGEIEAAGDVHAARDAGDRLDLLVEVDRVLLQLGDVGVAVQRVHAARGVPGRAGGQLGALDQHDVLPAALGQMIGDAGADDAAADDDDLCMRFHEDDASERQRMFVRAERRMTKRASPTAATATSSSRRDSDEGAGQRKRVGDRRRSRAAPAGARTSRRRRPRKSTPPPKRPGREPASAKPQGTIAPVPKPTIAKPTHARREAQRQRDEQEAAPRRRRARRRSACGRRSARARVGVEPQRRLAGREERAAEAGERRQLRRFALQQQRRPGERRRLAGDRDADDERRCTTSVRDSDAAPVDRQRADVARSRSAAIDAATSDASAEISDDGDQRGAVQAPRSPRAGCRGSRRPRRRPRRTPWKRAMIGRPRSPLDARALRVHRQIEQPAGEKAVERSAPPNSAAGARRRQQHAPASAPMRQQRADERRA